MANHRVSPIAIPQEKNGNDYDVKCANEYNERCFLQMPIPLPLFIPLLLLKQREERFLSANLRRFPTRILFLQ